MAKKQQDDHGRYSKVYRRMWNDARVRSLSWPPPNGLTLWQRLLTGPEIGVIPGCIQGWEGGFSQALRWTLEGFRDAFREVESQGLAKADWGAGFIWVPKAIARNKPASANVVKSWRDAWEELPECPLKLEAYESLREFLTTMHEDFVKAFDMSCRKPSGMPCGNQEQEQEQEQEGTPLTPLPTDTLTNPTSAEQPKPKRSRRKPQVPLPPDLQPLLRQNQFCAKHRLDVASQFDRFRANAEAKDLRYSDWHRAFDTWLGNALSWGKDRGGQARLGPVQTDNSGRTGFENAEIEHIGPR